MSEGISKLLDLIVQFANFFIPWTVLDAFEGGVILRWGKYHRTIGPGFHWCLPFNIDHVFTDTVVLRTKPIGLQSLLTKDARAITLTAIVTSSIEDVRKALLDVESVDQAMLDACAGAIGTLVTKSTWDEIVHEDFQNEMAKACRRGAKRYGIAIDRVQLMELTPARAIRLLQDDKAGAG